MKFCSKCKTYKLKKEFYKDKSRKDGLYPSCKKCFKKYRQCSVSKSNQKKAQKKYRQSLVGKITLKKYKQSLIYKATRKKYRQSSVGKVSHRKYEQSPKGKLAREKANKKYHQSPKGKSAQKRVKEKKLSTYKGKLNQRMSIAVCMSLKRQGVSKNGCHWETLVGFTVEELKKHLESQFENWMNWNNYGHGKDKWCIDHKKPIVSFDYDGPSHYNFKRCWALKNLQPMRCSENFSKCARLNWKKAA